MFDKFRRLFALISTVISKTKRGVTEKARPPTFTISLSTRLTVYAEMCENCQKYFQCKVVEDIQMEPSFNIDGRSENEKPHLFLFICSSIPPVPGLHKIPISRKRVEKIIVFHSSFRSLPIDLSFSTLRGGLARVVRGRSPLGPGII